MIDVLIQVSNDAVRPLRGQGPPSEESSELLEILEQLGASIEPLHPGAEDPKLSRHFRVQATDRAAAAAIAERLLEARAIRAAYVQPPEAAP